jgi:RHS repeat-associated protein
VGVGNIMATYTQKKTTSTSVVDLYLTEQDIYGSSRVGVYSAGLNLTSPVAVAPSTQFKRVIGNKQYEYGNHLGNVLVVSSDKKIPVDNNLDGIIDYFKAEVVSASDYTCFGAQMSGRTGFNGKRKDNEINGEGNVYDFDARMYNSRLGRWLSVDKRFTDYVPFSPYIYSLNSPVCLVDKDGNVVVDMEGHEVKVSVTYAKDGTATATYEFVANTSQATKDDFKANGERVINAMLANPRGQEDVERMKAMPTEIDIIINNEDSPGYYAATAKHGKVLGADGKTYAKSATLEIFMKPIENSKNLRIGAFLNVEEGLGATGSHESWHLDPDQIITDKGKTTWKKEEVPIAAEYEFILQNREKNSPETYGDKKARYETPRKAEDAKTKEGKKYGDKPATYGMKKGGEVRTEHRKQESTK